MRSDRTKRALVALTLAITIALAPKAARADGSDPMAEYRERFKSGLLRYQAGAVAEAVQWWEPIYRELGPERGWRLAFNLARAHDAMGDTTRAVERYEAFLKEVDVRKARGEAIEELIASEADTARDRLAEVARTKGRIVVGVGDAPVAAKIDGSEPRIAPFTAYVAPGEHVVVFEPGAATETRRPVTIAAGEAIDVVPPPRPKAPPSDVVATPAPPRTTLVREHPFPETVLYIAGGVTLVSAVVPILTYRSASDFQSANRLSGDTTDAALAYNSGVRADYDARRTTYYATLAIPITLAAVTGGLAAFYVFGARTREVPVTVTVMPGGGAASFTARF
ncbi:MAG: hypothetical protein U0235_13160 [Polyangiaceae bacterium]